MSATLPPPSLALRLVGIAAMLVERFLGQAKTLLPPGELVEAMWRVVQRAFVRVQVLATKPPHGAHHRPPHGLAVPRPARRRPAPRPAAPGQDGELTSADLWRANREHGWLLAMMPALRDVTEQLEDWLRERTLDDLLHADPRYIRAVRALGRMLGVNPDLLPPPCRAGPPDDPTEPDPTGLRLAPRGYPRHWRVNQQGFELLMAERNAAWAQADRAQALQPSPALQPAQAPQPA